MDNLKQSFLSAILFFLFLFIASSSLITFRGHALKLYDEFMYEYATGQKDYDSLWNSFKNYAQLDRISAKQYKYLYDGLIEAQFNDMNILLDLIEIDNPETSIYKDEMRIIITKARASYNRTQKRLKDIEAIYNPYIQKHDIKNRFFSFPIIDLDDYIVTN